MKTKRQPVRGLGYLLILLVLSLALTPLIWADYRLLLARASFHRRWICPT